MSEKNKPGVTKKDSNVTENGLVVQNIVIRPVVRGTKDIGNWRSYHQQAEGINGSRVALFDMYYDMLLDGFLQRLIAKRILSVTKNKLKYIDSSGKEIKGSDIILGTREFRKLRQRMRSYKGWGISVIELMNVDGGLKIFDVPKKHILPKEGKIVYEQYGVDGIDYRMPPYNKTVIEIGDWDDLGFLLQACCYVIYKRGVIADWANYAQIFGMPFREARYDGFNEIVRVQLEQAMEKAASAAWAVLPKDAEFKLHEVSNAAGSNELYDTLRRAMNEEMTVLILGATETTTSSKSSGYAQSQTHQQTVDEVVADDKEDELSILNEQVVPVMIALGLLPAGGTFVYNEPVNVETAAKKVDIAIKLKKDGGVPISDDYFYEVAGIPKPDNYDELKQKMEDEKKLQSIQPVDPQNPVPGKGNKPGKKDKQPKTGEEKKNKLEAKLKEWFPSFFDQAHSNK